MKNAKLETMISSRQFFPHTHTPHTHTQVYNMRR